LVERFQAYVDANRDRYLDELRALCAQPSIAAQGIGLEETADLISERLTGLGAQVQRIVMDDAPPILYAELGRGQQTMLVYNHYDVQPADPLDEWDSPPFEPTFRDGRLYARGVADDKGDLLCRLHAVEAYQATMGQLPVRLKFLFEGEEEVGSPHLDAFATQYPALLEADGCLWETASKDAARRPVLELGVKGLCYVELTARTAASDLHSMWGGVIPNAAWRLTWALNTLKDADERILVDGLMERVVPPTEGERAHLETIPLDEEQIKADFGFEDFVEGLTGTDLLVKHFYGPTCTICGLSSGYTGAGTKTVLPREAMAKVGFRLVPGLTPELVVDLLRAHLEHRGFGDLKVTLLGGIRPARSPLDAPFVQTCVEAARVAHHAEPVIYPTSAGSGPLYTICRDTPTVMAGVGNANSRYHAPNENVYVDDYFEGIRFIGELIHSHAG
jgi:acetylornithine deacetylase/succinyl-diaminopimelate desuccinylase-like protein